ncbi:MAG: LPS export ABC transporter periplasmic protein LptC [Candidatus Omnitrophica bacterium]|nr:LPS export ABC transporter periplasmic protein LptC [Candidatus Omnitrophota bacterium]
MGANPQKYVLTRFLAAFFMIAWHTVTLGHAQGLGTVDGTKQFQGFNLQGYSDEGDKAWDVNGETADILGSEIKIKNVIANTYGEEEMNVTADTGTINQDSGDMVLEKDVVITSKRGVQLMTDSLNWSRENDLVKTDDEVMITDTGMTVTGKGMEAKPGLKTARINEEVHVMVDTEPEREHKETNTVVTITCDGPMFIDQANGKATFEDNVVAYQEGRTLKADRMEVYFNVEVNEIEKLICIGNVEMLQGDNKSFAQKAVYNAKDQTVQLSGRPKLIMVTEGEGAITATRN